MASSVPSATELATIAQALNTRAAALDAAGRLVALRSALPGLIVFTTSLGLEDQVITHLIASAGLDIALATLDTGRLFPESYEVWQQTEARYGVRVEAFTPEAGALEALVARQGINGFYDSVEARKACCGIRKLEPLGRALAGAQGWVTGLRADQSEHRTSLAFVEFDEARGLVKLNPIFDWSRDQALAFAKTHDVPLNPLHERGFLSIGCAPCTRAIAPGEPERAGRWWWEDDGKKECGLHIGPDGKITRTGAPA